MGVLRDFPLNNLTSHWNSDISGSFTVLMGWKVRLLQLGFQQNKGHLFLGYVTL